MPRCELLQLHVFDSTPRQGSFLWVANTSARQLMHIAVSVTSLLLCHVLLLFLPAVVGLAGAIKA